MESPSRRLKNLTRDQLDAEQRAVYDAIVAGPRGGIAGPFLPWLRSPVLADRAQKLGEFCRFNSALPKRLSELAILMTGRFWTSQFEFWAHARLGRDAGLDQAIIDALAERRRPAKMQDDETAIFEFVDELLQNRCVGDRAYARVIALFGERGAVDLVGIIGYYCLVSLTLNAFELQVPPGETPPLKP